MINDQIRAAQVRLIDSEGANIGVVTKAVAIERAKVKGLDLVEVSHDSNPPVCKIMDYNRHHYELKKKLKENKKKSKVTALKQVRLSPNIGEHDLQFKSKQIVGFIKSGHKVKVNMRFRGREREHLDVGRAIMESVVENLKDIATCQSAPKYEGYYMTMFMVPNILKDR